MNVAKWRRRFIQALRIYPVVVLTIVGVGLLLGGFDTTDDSSLSHKVLVLASYLLIGVAPILAIIGFIVIGRAVDAEYKSNKTNQNKFNYGDAFEIPNEEMHGYKLTYLTGRPPMLTGLTGDTYSTDASATCSVDDQHIPPVMNCECGFYAFKELEEAKFELSIHPGSFLIDVDLYGIGFVYKRGFRAETQVVNNFRVPNRCMRCKVFTPKVFVPSFKLGLGNYSWWQWQIRCGLCSSSFKESDKVSIDEMSKYLKVSIS